MGSMHITDPILMFSFIMFVILFSPLIFARMRMPGIVGLIFSGIIVGPHALGILRLEGAMELFSSVGLIYIMFLAGLEINLHEFSRQKRYSIVFGAMTFSIPMVFGTLGAKYLFTFSWPSALLLASMFASHTLIPLSIVSRLGLNRERSVIATVGGTIITDTAALLVLAMVVEWVTTQLSALFMLRQIILLVALVWFALWVLPRVVYLLFKVFPPDGGMEFIWILSLVFFTSYLSRLVGVEPIIGAFFAGLALSGTISEQSPLMNRLEFVGNTLFIPFFLLSVGMLVNLRVMFSGWDVWRITLFMVTGVVVCKYLAATLFQKTMKFTLNERDLIFGLSVNQAAATLAAVIVGFRIGLFDEAVLSGTIMMILATCLVGPWFTERSGLKIASQKVKSPERAYRGEERVMVAMGRRESVEMLTGVALSLRGSSSKEPVFPLFVAQDGVDVDKRIAFGENILSVAVAHAVSADVPVSPISRIDINVAGGILHATKEWHIDTLVMGSIPSPEVNFRSLLFGVYDKVCDDSDLLILMCRTAHPMSLDKNIFVVVPPMLECQPGFARAFRALKNIAYGNKLQLRVVGTENTIRQLEKTPQKKGPGAEVAYITIGKFKDVDPYLSDNIAAKSDVIVIMAAKKGRLAWHPSLRNLVHDLGHKFPGNNIIMAHPSDRGGQEEEMPLTCAIAGTDTPGSDVSIRVEIKEKTPESFIKSLLEKKFPPGSLILAESMKSLRPFEPIALTPEIMLLHTHSGYLDAPVILLGIHREGIVFSGSPKSAHALFLLVSPKDATSVHLTALMGVARMAQELQKERPWADLK